MSGTMEAAHGKKPDQHLHPGQKGSKWDPLKVLIWGYTYSSCIEEEQCSDHNLEKRIKSIEWEAGDH
jgi:hypothetical protein